MSRRSASSRAMSDCLLAAYNAGLDWQFLHCTIKCLMSSCCVWIRQLEQDATWLNHGDPQLWVSFSGTHASFGWLLGY